MPWSPLPPLRQECQAPTEAFGDDSLRRPISKLDSSINILSHFATSDTQDNHTLEERRPSELMPDLTSHSRSTTEDPHFCGGDSNRIMLVGNIDKGSTDLPTLGLSASSLESKAYESRSYSLPSEQTSSLISLDVQLIKTCI